MGKTAEEKRRERVDKAVERLRRRKQKIQEWMYGGHVYNKAPSASRAPGIPAGNIIEERRLEETLYEIGKKRMEYINSYENERFRFTEKQKRKSSAVRRLMVSDSDVISRGWSVGDRSLGRENASLDLLSSRRPTPKEVKVQFQESQMEVLEKSQENPNIPKLGKENTVASSKGKSVQFTVFQTEAHLSREPTAAVDESDLLVIRSRTPTLVRFPALLRNKSRSMLTTSSLIPWGQMKSTSIQPGTYLPPITKDPRFRRLEKLLSPQYVSTKTRDIGEIVKNYRALHVPPDVLRVSRLEREQQIKQFMKDRGLVF